MDIKDCIHKIKNNSFDKVTFIILCGNKAKIRGRHNIALTNITSQYKLIDYQVSIINSQFENAEIILIVGFEAQEVINYINKQKYKNCRIFENVNYNNNSAIDAWRFGINCSIQSNCYIIHGDRVFNKRAIATKYPNDICISTYKKEKKNSSLGLICQENTLINISYGLPDVWSEIFFIPERHYAMVKDSINNLDAEKIYTIDKFINYINRKTSIRVDIDKAINIIPLKEIV